MTLSTEHILIIGDPEQKLASALEQAVPNARVKLVPDYFEGIAQLTSERYTTVLAAADPIERRPEAAVQTLRQVSGDARLILFGQPSLEPVSQPDRKTGDAAIGSAKTSFSSSRPSSARPPAAGARAT